VHARKWFFCSRSCSRAAMASAEYDKDAVVKAMRSNLTLYGSLRAAATTRTTSPPREPHGHRPELQLSPRLHPAQGTKKDWDDTHKALISAAFRGIGVCGEQDQQKLSAVVAEVGQFMQKGTQPSGSRGRPGKKRRRSSRGASGALPCQGVDQRFTALSLR